MTLSRFDHAQLEAEMAALQARGVPFAMATVVRTVNSTSAKPGVKALVDQDGAIVMGWIGGGCARSAVTKATRQAIASGAPQLISLRPQDLLETEGLRAGETRDGTTFARNGCPSEGTMDIFVEPVLPLPQLVICGSGLVAMALADLAKRFDYQVVMHVADGVDINPDSVHEMHHGFDFKTQDFIVVATQGQGDLPALRAALTQKATSVSFVGSTKKFAALAEHLKQEDDAFGATLAAVHAPAGLAIHAITPDEIALSILAQMTQTRRQHSAGQDHKDG